MKKIFLFLSLCIVGVLNAQPPKLYIHIVSHNEPTDNIESSQIVFNKFKNNALQMASIVNSKNVKWNLQTSDGFVLGALQYENAGTSSTDVFETLANAPYSDNIEIDPRSKNKGGRNIADQWYLLDSCGANPSHHLGGCIYTTTNSTIQPIDWLQYRNPIIGNIYGNSWQCSLITGAGSYPPHTNDLNDFGVFKPDTTTNFYSHNPNKNLWCMGTGCAPKLDSTSDEQHIIDLIQGQVDSIQNGLWPQNKFYVTRIMTNQRSYGPLFFQKISKVIDSINAISSTKIQWANISEVFTAFQTWQNTSGLDHSMWLCGQTNTGIENTQIKNNVFIYPNPVADILTIEGSKSVMQVQVLDILGREVLNINDNNIQTLNISELTSGVYFIKFTTTQNDILKIKFIKL